MQYIPYPFLRQQRRKGVEEGTQSNSARDRVVKVKHANSRRAEPRASSSNRARPASASSVTRRVVQASRDVDRVFTSNRDIILPLGKCRSQDRGFSVGPWDFDPRTSAIYKNIPAVGLSAAAESARVGWGGSNIHDLRRQIRMQIAHEGNLTTGEGRSPSNRAGGASPEERSGTAGQRRSGLGVISGDNSHRRARSTNKLRRRDFNGLKESREAAAKRAAAKEVIRRLTIRLQILWQELRVPHPDRAHMTAAYLEGGSRAGTGSTSVGPDGEGTRPTSDQVRNELVRQVELLLNYRTSTVKVLRCIASREARLDEVEQALQAFRWHRGRDTDALGSVDALAGLRHASVDVVLAILDWRNNLHQPRAFCWRGVNYLEKMSRDTIFLCCPVGRSLLASVGLGVENMTFILFSSVDEGDEVRALGCNSLGVELSGFRPPPAMVRLTPRAELVEEYRARFFDQSAGVVIEGGDSRHIGTGKEKTRIVEVVMKEPELQRRMQIKRERLAAKGCFVPLLRRLPVDGRTPARDRKRHGSSNAIPAPSEPRLYTNISYREGRYGSAQRVEGTLGDPRPPWSLTENVPRPRDSQHEPFAQAPDADGTEQYGFREEPKNGDDSGERRGQDSQRSQHDEAKSTPETDSRRYRVRGVIGANVQEKAKGDARYDQEEVEGHEKQSVFLEQQGTLDEESLPRHRKKGHQMSAGFDEIVESSFRCTTDDVGETVDSKCANKKEFDERPDLLGCTGRASSSDLSVDSRQAPEEAATMTKQVQRDRKHKGQQRTNRDEHETVLPGQETGRQGMSDRVELPEARGKQHVVSEVGDVRSDMGRHETRMGGVNTVGVASFLGMTRGSDNHSHRRGSGRLGKDHVSTTGVSSSSWTEQVGRGADGDHDGKRKQSETGMLPSGSSEEDDGRVSNSLLYDEDFEGAGDNEYSFFTESERDDVSHRSSNLGEDREHEVNWSDVHASVKPDEDDNVREDEDHRTRSSVAFVIQCAWRRRAAWKSQEELQRRRFELENAAAVDIQRVAKAYNKERRYHVLLEEENAKKLQLWLTARQVERETKRRQMQRDAVERIQSAARGKRARDEVRKRRRQWGARKIDAAVRIQALARQRKAQALLAEQRATGLGEKQASNSVEEDPAFEEESTSERGEREGCTTQLTEGRLARAPVIGERGAGLSSLEGRSSRSEQGIKENGPELPIRDGLSTAVAPDSSPSLPARAPASTGSSSSLLSAGLRSLSSASVPPSWGWSGSEEVSLGGNSSSSGASDSLLRDTRRRQWKERAAGDAEGGHEELDKSMVENESHPSERPVAVDHDEDVSQVKPRVVKKKEVEGDAERLSTMTKLSRGVDELLDDANASRIKKLHNSGERDLANVVLWGAERDTASTAEEAVLTITTKNIGASTPDHKGRASGEAPEYGSEDMDFDPLSSSSSSRPSIIITEIRATGNGKSVDPEESPKTESMTITKPIEPSQGARDAEKRGDYDDSDGSLLSLSASDSS